MSRLALFFLSCLMTLSILTSTEAGGKATNSIPHPDAQCQSEGHKAACYRYSHHGNMVDCDDLKCVTRRAIPREDGKYRGVGIGKAFDGTHCGVNKVCRKGVCTELGRNERMPKQDGQNSEIRQCY